MELTRGQEPDFSSLYMGIVMPGEYSLSVYKTDYLPVQATYPACSIETQEEVSVASDNWIHMVKVGGRLYVSGEVYEMIKNDSDVLDLSQAVDYRNF